MPPFGSSSWPFLPSTLKSLLPPRLQAVHPSPPTQAIYLILLPLPRSHSTHLSLRSPAQRRAGGAMAAANGSGGKGFEVPKVEVRFTKLFINGQFVDAVSGTPPIIRASLSPPPFLHPSSPLVLPGDLLNERRCRRLAGGVRHRHCRVWRAELMGKNPSRFSPNDDACRPFSSGTLVLY